MEERTALMALSALSHPARLALLRSLLPAGPAGLPAGELGRKLAIPANALSFHLRQLRQAGMVKNRRNGRQILYTADYAGMQGLIGFLTDNCCADSEDKCSPVCAPRGRRKRGIGKERARRQSMRALSKGGQS